MKWMWVEDIKIEQKKIHATHEMVIMKTKTKNILIDNICIQ